MGIFNRKKKQQLIEIENEFDYDKMLKEAKLCNIFEGSKLFNVIEKGMQHQYDYTSEKTPLIGVYDKNNKLLLVLKYDLEQKILFDYLLLPRLFLLFLFLLNL